MKGLNLICKDHSGNVQEERNFVFVCVSIESANSKSYSF